MQAPTDIARDRLRLEGLAGRLAGLGLVVGLAGLAVAAGLFFAGGEEKRASFFASYLVNYAYFLSLALGALFFVMIQHLTRAGWSVVVRRTAETFAANLWLMALLVVPLLFGLHELFEWTHGEVVEEDSLLLGKAPYLNQPFFLLRCAAYFLVWIGLSEYLFRRSVRQDETGDPAITVGLERISAPGTILFALTVTFFAFDFLMSTDPHWYSTILGVYYFSGAALGLFALLPLTLILLQSSGRLERAVTVEHYHDMGKLLFAFLVFWAYIAFSQYLLIWYANIPEETGWFLRRQEGPWAAVSIALVVGHFLLPFVAFLSRFPKRRRPTLALVALWVLLMHWVDLYWLVIPNLSPDRTPFGLADVALFVGMGGLFLAAAALRLRRRSLVPVKDPRLGESLAFENA